jgi:hypothetical protein
MFKDFTAYTCKEINNGHQTESLSVSLLRTKYSNNSNIYRTKLHGNKTKKPTMPDINITNHGISKLLSNLDPSSKAAGPDELKPKILKRTCT